LVSAIVGAVIVMLLSIVKNIKLNMKINNQEKTIAELQKENEKNLSQFVELEKKYEELLVEDNVEDPQIDEPKGNLIQPAEKEEDEISRVD